MHSPGINGEGELRGQPANPGSPGKMAVKTKCVFVCVCVCGDINATRETLVIMVATDLENMEKSGNMKVVRGKVRENVFLPLVCYREQCK